MSASGVPGLVSEAGQTVHLDVALVAHDQSPLGVDHGQAVRHVGERHLEPPVLQAQLLLALLQDLVLVPQLLLDPAPLRQVADGIDLVGAHAAAQGPAHDLDRDDKAGGGLERRLDRFVAGQALPAMSPAMRSPTTRLPSSSSEDPRTSCRMRRLTLTTLPSLAMTRPSSAASTSSWLRMQQPRDRTGWRSSVIAITASITTHCSRPSPRSPGLHRR